MGDVHDHARPPQELTARRPARRWGRGRPRGTSGAASASRPTTGIVVRGQERASRDDGPTTHVGGSPRGARGVSSYPGRWASTK
jgi:hypothetical protein